MIVVGRFPLFTSIKVKAVYHWSDVITLTADGEILADLIVTWDWYARRVDEPSG